MAILAAAVPALVALVTSPAQAQTSPVGTWDFILSGSQKGVAFISFSNDFTLRGTEVVTVKPADAPDSNPRQPRPGGIRVDGSSSTNSSTNVYFFGTTDIRGVWAYDVSGGIVGVFQEGEDDLVNQVSFRGKRSGSKLNLVGHHEDRKIHYRGIPQPVLPDLQGRYYGTGKRDGTPFVQIFDLRPDPDSVPNRYVVVPFAPPNEITNGVALVSGQNQMAITTLNLEGTNFVLSALSGAFKVNKGRGSLSGVDESHERVTEKLYRLEDED